LSASPFVVFSAPVATLPCFSVLAAIAYLLRNYFEPVNPAHSQ
jgi:hypothetical protein